jgi:hypothetical protein
MRLGSVVKQPGERRQYAFGYSDALISGDVLATAVLKSVEPAGLTVDTVSVDGANAVFWAESGVSGERYWVTLTVTTNAGEIFEDELLVKVAEVP